MQCIIVLFLKGFIMQSIAPVSDPDPSWKMLWNTPGFILWMLAIVAMIYNSIAYKGYTLQNYPVWVFFLLLLYYMVVKLWYNASIVSNGSLFNGALFVSILVALIPLTLKMGTYIATSVYFSLVAIWIIFRAYQISKTNASYQDIILKPSINAMFFSLSVLFPISMIYDATNDATTIYAKEKEDATSQKDKNAVPSPLGYKIMIGSAITIMMVALIMFRWNHADFMQTTVQLGSSMYTDFLKTFPLLQYLKYVANNDYMDAAKRVTIVALLAYVAHLMFSVYIQKDSLSACMDASCFDHPAFFGTSNVPYVNTLFWVLIYSSMINVVNWIIKTFGTSWIGTSSMKGAVEMKWNRAMTGAAAASTPPANPPTDFGTLIRLLIFPFYWIFTMFVQNPVVTIIAIIAFAVTGLLLYRSSFDLTTFMEGQRGTVISLLTLFIVSLIVFGMYSMNSSTTAMTQGVMSYGQFIAKTGMIIAAVVCVVSLLLYCLNTHSKMAKVASVAQFGITALIYITGIAIVIGIMRTAFSTSRKMGGTMFQVSPDSNWVINLLKLTANLLFYVPCLMLDAVDMIKEQYGLTTRPMLILLAMEAAFILAGHVLPSAVVKALNHTGVHILSAPVSMTNLASTDYAIHFVDVNSLSPPVANATSDSQKVLLHNYNYGVSAWFYIHPQPPNTNSNYNAATYMNLMQVGDSFGPVMQYNPTINTIQFSIYGKQIVSAENPKDTFTVTDIPLQTWNNVVINSDKGVIDIFINNSLVYTGDHLPDDANKSKEWFTIQTGQADGIHGEICNIMLNTTPFSKTEIAWLYKTNKALNPPVVGIEPDAADPLEDESESGMRTFSIVGAMFGALFGWLFNDEADALKGLVMGAIVFGLIGALFGKLFSTDGTIAYILKTAANVFVDTF